MSTLESTSCQPVKKPKHLEQSYLTKIGKKIASAAVQSNVPNPAITLVNSGTTSKIDNTITYRYACYCIVNNILQDVVTFYYYHCHLMSLSSLRHARAQSENVNKILP